MSTMINRKKAAKAGLVAGLGALAAAPIIATAKAVRDSSSYRDDYIISRSSDYYYWRRWRLPRRNRLLQRLLLVQQRLGRLLNIGAATSRHKARKAHARHCTYYDGGWVDARWDDDQTYSMRPETVLPDEPGHLR
jgi:hypothetical protein